MLHQREAAETIGLKALAWLVGKEDLLAGFLDATGASPDELRTGARDGRFLGSVLDYLLSDDALVIAFCDGAGLPNEAPMQARAHLPGGDIPHWT